MTVSFCGDTPRGKFAEHDGLADAKATPARSPASSRPRLALSIVSHCQFPLVATLLDDLRDHVDGSMEIFVTLNVPEPADFPDNFPIAIEVIRNPSPLGFGANHNQALRRSHADVFVVMNPDVRLRGFRFAPLLETLQDPALAACSPLVVGPSGNIEDNARRFPSAVRIASRVMRRLRGLRIGADYPLLAKPVTHVDWVAGMFVCFRATCFREVGGFDTRYFMYLEDADICRRLSVAGYGVVVDSRTRIVHDARRATLRDGRHLRWHATSLLRFFARSLKIVFRPPAGRPRGAR